MSHMERNRNRFFLFYIGKKSVCVYEGKMPPMQLLTAAVWLMDRLFAEGCWLRDVLTKIWLAKPKAYFITHKTFHLLVLCSTECPSLSVLSVVESPVCEPLSLFHICQILPHFTAAQCLFPAMTVWLLFNWVFLTVINGLGPAIIIRFLSVNCIHLICCLQSVFVIVAPNCFAVLPWTAERESQQQ